MFLPKCADENITRGSMACPRGYRGRHTGLYRDTEGKQPVSAYPRRRWWPKMAARPAQPGRDGQLAGRLEARGRGNEVPGYTRSIAGRPPRAQPARLGSFKG